MFQLTELIPRKSRSGFLISNEAKHHKFKGDKKKCIFMYKCGKSKKSQGISEIYVFLNSILVKN